MEEASRWRLWRWSRWRQGGNGDGGGAEVGMEVELMMEPVA